MILQWTQEESTVFDALEVPDDRRGSTYLAAFLSCWWRTFALPEDEKDSFVLAPLKQLVRWRPDAHLALLCLSWQACIEA